MGNGFKSRGVATQTTKLFLKSCEKPLDKTKKLCYNKDTKSSGKEKKRIFQKTKKVLDKQKNLCYNKSTK